jgi:hypothetical protein
MQSLVGFLGLLLAVVNADVQDKGHHHHHHKHHKQHHKHHKPAVATKPAAAVKATVQAGAVVHTESNIVDKMRQLEAKLAEKAKAQANARSKGHLLVNGPVPADFGERFAQAVAQATGSDAAKVKVIDSAPLEGSAGIIEVAFEASPKVVKSVENSAADPESKLAKGSMHSLLVAKEEDEKPEEKPEEKPKAKKSGSKKARSPSRKEAPAPEETATPVEEKGIDIDTAMPYGDLEPFGREDTAQELTESSVKESDEMVDQLERAEVAEEKRSVFRALTRLRGAAITSFDGVARSQTGNIDEYNKIHKWRKTHPLHHLADEESDVTKWAFPDNADF